MIDIMTMANIFAGIMVAIILVAGTMEYGLREKYGKSNGFPCKLAVIALVLMLLDTVAFGNLVGGMIYVISFAVLIWFMLTK